jgi:hypothetical protein
MVAQASTARTEIAEGDITISSRSPSPAEVTIPGSPKRLKGIVLDIDSSLVLKDDASWMSWSGGSDAVHAACKKMFFSLLRPRDNRSP